MSFGTNNTTKTAQNNMGGVANAAQNTMFPQMLSEGTTALNTGAGNVNSGANYFNTLLGGNRANTSAMMQPSVDQIREGNANTMNSISTLLPRSGGRSGALFGQSFAPQQQLQSLFNGARTTAATTLPQIGLQQQQVGTNLFGLGNNALSVAGNTNSSLAQSGLQAQQMNNQLWGQIGSGLMSLATLPVNGAGSSLAGSLFSGVGKAGGGVQNMPASYAFGW